MEELVGFLGFLMVFGMGGVLFIKTCDYILTKIRKYRENNETSS